MDNKNKPRNQQETEQPGSLSSYNNREDNRQGSVENVKEEKDASESYLDYNGNSLENAPARSRKDNEQ